MQHSSIQGPLTTTHAGTFASPQTHSERHLWDAGEGGERREENAEEYRGGKDYLYVSSIAVVVDIVATASSCVCRVA